MLLQSIAYKNSILITVSFLGCSWTHWIEMNWNLNWTLHVCHLWCWGIFQTTLQE